jgi:miniconductance mechanosensitive channel
MIDSLVSILQNWHFEPTLAVPAATITAALMLLLLIVTVELAISRVLLRFIKRFAQKTATRLDDLLVQHRVFSGLARLITPVLVYLLAVPVLAYYPAILPLIREGSVIYMTIALVLVIFSSLDALFDFLIIHPVGRKLPVKSVMQVIKTLVVSIGLIYMVSRLFGKSPVVFFSGLGAFTAVLLLIFKDAILGLVAGVQLSTNNLVSIGDWVELPKYGANGEVIDISLVTVSVQNYDKSIVSLPSYTLISEGFKNWRGMKEAEGRRIKFSISVDMSSIRFLDEELKKKLESIQLIHGYMLARERDVAVDNMKNAVDETSPVNGRCLTNLGTFRAYLTEYISQYPRINPEMMIMVHYLQPDGLGLPCEIYCFSLEKEWVPFESVQADIMDHMLAVLPFFGLRVFPSSPA